MSADVLHGKILECENASSLRTKPLLQIKYKELEAHLAYTKSLWDRFPWELQVTVATRCTRQMLEHCTSQVASAEDGEVSAQDLFHDFLCAIEYPDPTKVSQIFEGTNATLFTVLHRLIKAIDVAAEEVASAGGGGGSDQWDLEAILDQEGGGESQKLSIFVDPCEALVWEKKKTAIGNWYQTNIQSNPILIKGIKESMSFDSFHVIAANDQEDVEYCTINRH